MPLDIRTTEEFEQYVGANREQAYAQIHEACTQLQCKPNNTATLVLDMSCKNARTIYSLACYGPIFKHDKDFLLEKVTAFTESKELADKVISKTTALATVYALLELCQLDTTLTKMRAVELPEDTAWVILMCEKNVYVGALAEEPITNPFLDKNAN